MNDDVGVSPYEAGEVGVQWHVEGVVTVLLLVIQAPRTEILGHLRVTV